MSYTWASMALKKDKIIKFLQEMKSFIPEKINLISELENYVVDQFGSSSAANIDQEFAFSLYFDGACRGNPGPGGWGCLGLNQKGETLFEASGFEAHTTNNRMELQGAIEAFKTLLEQEPKSQQVKCACYGDSKYVLDGLEKWLPGWKAKGWKKADGAPPLNSDLWQELDILSQKFSQMKFIWVKGHSGHPQNERCDQLANEAIDELLA